MITVKTPKLANNELATGKIDVLGDDNTKAIKEVKAIILANENRIGRDDLIMIGKKYPKAFQFNTKRVTETVEIGFRNTPNFLLLKRNFMRNDFSVLPLQNENRLVW